MKRLGVSEVLTLLEDTIEDWGDQAKGGDAFTSDDLIEESKGYDRLNPNPVNVTGFDHNTQILPVCLIGTMAHGLGIRGSLGVYALAQNYDLTEDAQLFLDHVVAAVDGEPYYAWDFPVTEYPKNPKRDWRLALDRVLKAWELA